MCAHTSNMKNLFPAVYQWNSYTGVTQSMFSNIYFKKLNFCFIIVFLLFYYVCAHTGHINYNFNKKEQIRKVRLYLKQTCTISDLLLSGRVNNNLWIAFLKL